MTLPARHLTVPAGFRAAAGTCGIKPSGRSDLALIASDAPARCAAVFTQNAFVGAPVIVGRRHAARGRVRAIVCNSGHFNVELNLDGLRKLARKVRRGVRNNVDEYLLPGNRRIYVLAEGRLVNLAAAEGHPASVMDMSFAVQALSAEYAVKNAGRLEVKVHPVPAEVDSWVARLKLKSMGIRIDTLTAEQRKYLASSEMGT